MFSNFIQLFVAVCFAQTIQSPIMIPDAPPVMIEIARCESSQRQFNDNGSLVIGTTKDIGYFQISPAWDKTAKAMGLDIRDPKDNIQFALWLYKKYGTVPWNSSKKCWGTRSS